VWPDASGARYWLCSVAVPMLPWCTSAEGGCGKEQRGHSRARAAVWAWDGAGQRAERDQAGTWIWGVFWQ
jgi:hypothetical protein